MNTLLFGIVQQGRWWCPMCPAGHAWGWGMWLWMILFWVIVIALIIWLVYRLTGSRGLPQGRGAEETLHERYARGEIDSETYHRMLDDLRKGRG
jgi:putative membrane protein